jgi:hypothetical protein
MNRSQYNEVRMMVEAMHSIYVYHRSDDGKKQLSEVRELCKQSLLNYWSMSILLSKLEISNEDDGLSNVIDWCAAKDNMDKWFWWASIDSNLATVGLNGHIRKPKSDKEDANGSRKAP